jgi:hypothetical protein
MSENKLYSIDFSKVESFKEFNLILKVLNFSLNFYAEDRDFCLTCGKLKDLIPYIRREEK